MKILTTKVRPGSLSEAIVTELKMDSIINEVVSLPPDLELPVAIKKYIDVETNVLINTIGETYNAPVGMWGTQRTFDIISNNLVTAVNLTEEFYIATRYSNNPKLIIHIGSTGSRKVFTNSSVYCAAKAGLAHYIECAGYELKDKKFSVIGIHPDNIHETPMTQKVICYLQTVRGMQTEEINGIYKDAISPIIIARFIVDIIKNTELWKFINGENFYMGLGCKRGGR